jgi:hypothetical protein
MVSAQINIKVRYIGIGHKELSFNDDGTRRVKSTTATASDFVKIREEPKIDLRASKVGAAGTIQIRADDIRPSGGFHFKPEPVLYYLVY